MEVFKTFLDCCALGEAVPVEVHLDYFPETDTGYECVEIYDMIFLLESDDSADGELIPIHRMPTGLQNSNIEETYLDQLNREGEEE